MIRRRARIANLGFETLERRCCLAGNVTAALVGGDLVITGDAEANVISVVESANDGEFVILAERDSGDVATSLNGTGNGAAVIAGVTGNIVINMHGGADVVAVANIDHVGNLTIDAGAWIDNVSAARVALRGGITIHAGGDQNTVTLVEIDVSGSLLVDSGTSATRQVPNVYLLVDSTIAGDARFDLGARAGSVDVGNVQITGKLEVENSDRNDALPEIYLNLRDTYAAVRLHELIVGTFISIRSSASTLVSADKVFSGGGFSVQAYTSFNAFEIHNSRSFGGLGISTLAPTYLPQFPIYPSMYDVLEVTGVIADGGLVINTSGDVRIAYSRSGTNSKVTTYSFTDTVVFDTNVFERDLSISIGGGNDTLKFRDSVIVGELAVTYTRRGQNDSFVADGTSIVSMSSRRFGKVNLAGRFGTDEVRIAGCVIDQLSAQLNNGSDLLEITASTFNQGARLDGADGFDLFRDLGNTFHGLELLNFEAVGG